MNVVSDRRCVDREEREEREEQERLFALDRQRELGAGELTVVLESLTKDGKSWRKIELRVQVELAKLEQTETN